MVNKDAYITYIILMCCEVGLFGAAVMLATVALGIQLIMLRLSRQYAQRHGSSSTKHAHPRLLIHVYC